MKPIVFDSSALLAYFFGEKSFPEVQKLLKTAIREDQPLLLSPVNLGEIYYIVKRRSGEVKARTVIKMLDELFIETPSVDKETSLEAAQIKSEFGLGYADAFAAALAIKRQGDLVTADEDFKPLEKQIKIHWI